MEDPRRSYKDANHKPELICALEPFHALCGFRPLADSLALLESLELVDLLPAYAALRERKASRALRSCCEQLWQLDQAQRDEALDALRTSVHRALDQGSRTHEAMLHDLLFVAEQHPGDAGLLFFPLLHHVVLQPGEALFLPSGCLHSYLHGVGIEIMANSDNVLRGGLTPKHVNVSELLRTIRFEPFPLRKIAPAPALESFEYEPDAEEFALNMQHFEGRRTWRRAPLGPELLICTEGELRLHVEGQPELLLQGGSSAFVPAALREYSVSGRGRLFVAHLGAGPSVPASRF
jgi:mannose-6-phosphate isomerase